jgi:hypothetical protein
MPGYTIKRQSYVLHDTLKDNSSGDNMTSMTVCRIENMAKQ